MLDKHIKTSITNNNLSYMSNSAQNVFVINTHRSNSSYHSVQEKPIDSFMFDNLPTNQRTMNYDTVFEGPNQSDQLKKVDGYVRHDRRIKLNRTMTDVSKKMDFGVKISNN